MRIPNSRTRSFNSVFLQPLPVEKLSELNVYGTDSSNAQNAVLGAYMPVSYPNYVDYKTQNHVFAEPGVYSFPNAVSMAGGENPHPSTCRSFLRRLCCRSICSILRSAAGMV